MCAANVWSLCRLVKDHAMHCALRVFFEYSGTEGDVWIFVTPRSASLWEDAEWFVANPGCKITGRVGLAHLLRCVFILMQRALAIRAKRSEAQ